MSVQEVGTPPELLEAVQRRWGPIEFDLAANAGNAVFKDYLGPGSRLGEDALVKDWSLYGEGLFWLNPPFNNIAPFMQKCVRHRCEVTIAALVPFTTAKWARLHVWPFAYVHGLAGRVKFVGHKAGHRNDMMVCLYGPGFSQGFSIWDWR